MNPANIGKSRTFLPRSRRPDLPALVDSLMKVESIPEQVDEFMRIHYYLQKTDITKIVGFVQLLLLKHESFNVLDAVLARKDNPQLEHVRYAVFTAPELNEHLVKTILNNTFRIGSTRGFTAMKSP